MPYRKKCGAALPVIECLESTGQPVRYGECPCKYTRLMP